MTCVRSCVSGFAVVAFFGIIAGTPGIRAEETTPELGISGFFDVNAGPAGKRDNPFALGPFELDLESTLNEHVSGSAAIVYQDDIAEVGVGFVDLHMFGEGQSSSSPRGRIFSDPGYHVQIGRFDIPFGLDYLLYATPDRPTVTPPLSTELMFEGGWTDNGIRVLKAHPVFNTTLYVVNGFDEGYAVGGRIGLRPFENPFSSHTIRVSPLLEIGVSGALDMDKKSNRQLTIAGADLEMNIPAGRVLAEYMMGRNHDTCTDQKSWYLMTILPGRMIGMDFVSRYEEQRNDIPEESDDLISRVTFGLSKKLFEITSIKAEYIRYIHGASILLANPDTYTIQVVITF